jgi:RND family efflux transporter MFP subunit
MQDSRKLFGLLAACGLGLGTGLLSAETLDQPPAVRVVEPQRHDFELVSTQPGTAEAFYEADLGAKVSGYVGELDVDIGARVKKGQVLARITVPELVQARKGAAAEVAALDSEYHRIATLAERNSVTQKTLTEAKSRLDTARAKQAEVEARMAYATIEAPFDGIVTSRAIDPGDMVFEASSPKGSNTPLLQVAEVDVIRVKTYVPERESAWLDVGDPATVAFDALAGRTFEGRVSRAAEALDPATRTMLVEIDLPNTDGRIRPGYYAQTRITLEKRGKALALPSSAVRLDGDSPFVFVVVSGDTVRRTPVGIGLDSQGFTEIVNGLAGGERVVADGAGALADGSSVRVVAP